MKHLILTAALATIAAQSAAFALPSAPAPSLNDSPIKTATVDAFAPGLNPRTAFEGITELAVSIYQSGLLTPLIVREHGGKLQIGAGERRWRALCLLSQGFEFEVKPASAGEAAVTVFMKIDADYPVMYQVREMNDAQMIELAITENSNRQDLTVLEKIDVLMFWADSGMDRQEIALKAAISMSTVDAYLRLGYGLGRDGRKLYSEGKINFKKAVILASVTGSLKQTLIKAARNGMNAHDLQAIVKVSAFTTENAVFDVDASGLTVEPRLFDSELPPRFADQRAALALQVDTLTAQAEQHRAAGQWADVLPVDNESGVLPAGYQHHGNSPVGKLWTYSTVTGKVSSFEDVRRTADEQATKAAARAASTTSTNTATRPAAPAPAKTRSERDDEQAEREAQQEATVSGLMNTPRVTLVHTVLCLFDAPRADRTVPSVQRFARNIAQDKPELFRLLSPGVLELKVSKVDALKVLRLWSEPALCELLAYLTSAPIKDDAYADALLEATD